jgi:hypothetical protein
VATIVADHSFGLSGGPAGLLPQVRIFNPWWEMVACGSVDRPVKG